ncbi:hypothetical protein GCM10011344_11340 [Dokdonia pacifica]|uniref:Peptidase family S41 n=1 Tax=Dokdonia pacifica TaxID=1627892 RepID=A0A238YH28_9FLAO|nr:S41 family peptidase [Dokdonia pacifica]GGG12382.1 hypothetical protein GCM10011344_11340 [Dokdonia pacifica]SNR70380.1 Peptidase family S41 [Dokdonia pacifica]
MRTSFMLFAISFICFTGISQQLQLEKASPFTAVKWENDIPIVTVNNEWYTLEKLDLYTTEELVAFCKKQYGLKWKKRFSEDLVEVLKTIGYQPQEKVTLVLSNKATQQKEVIGIFTLENRQKVVAYNHTARKTNKSPQKITIQQAINDIEEFQQILELRSSYVHLTAFDYKTAIASLKNTITASKEAIEVNYLTHELAKILAEIGDRHSSVKNESFVKESHATYSLQLPFSLASLNGQVVAVCRTTDEESYEYLHADFPFVKSINDIAIHTMIDSLVYKHKKAPEDAKLSRGVSEIQQLGKIYFANNLQLPKQTKIVFTNGHTDKTAWVQLQSKQSPYYSKIAWNTYIKSKEIKNGKLAGISKLLNENIGYISLPRMYHFKEVKAMQEYIDSTFTAFENTKALIIDIRFNPGGGRDLIQKFANYIVPTSNSPWVANVAYLRTEAKNTDHSSMSNRFLYPYASDKWSETDKASITAFLELFNTQKKFDTTKFSNPHYMILHAGKHSYNKPIYILVNERSFSAATVFTSAFKGLPNVTIAGVTTDGSSGNSQSTQLKHSNIRVKISTMLSFQRNGKTLDGNGTKPDIYLPINQDQLLKGTDTQLKQLVKHINEK